MECHTLAIFYHHLIFHMAKTSCHVIAHVMDFFATTECVHPGTGLCVRAVSQQDAVSQTHSDQIAASFSFLSLNQLSLSLCCLPSFSSPPQVSCDRSGFLDDCFQQESSASDSVKPNRKMPACVVTVHLAIVCSFILLFAHSLSSFSCSFFSSMLSIYGRSKS